MSGVIVSYVLLGISLEVNFLLEMIVSLVGDTYTGSICAKDTYTGFASAKGACVGSVYAIERLGMYLQVFQVLDIRSAE